MGGKSSKPKMKVTQFRMSLHYGVCMKADALRHITYGEKVIWKGATGENYIAWINDQELNGGLKKEGGVSGYAMILLGGSDQVMPPGLAQRLNPETPSVVPAFRGVTSVFFTGDHPTNVGRVGGRPGGGVLDPNNPNGFTDIMRMAFGDFSMLRANRGFYWTANSPYVRELWFGVDRYPRQLNPDNAKIPRVGHIKRTSFYFAIDRSGSMDGSRTNAMRAVMSAALDYLSGVVSAGVDLDIGIAGWGTSTSVKEFRHATTANIAALKAFINTLGSLGGTDFTYAARPAMDWFEASRGDPSIKRRVFLFITDGEPSPVSSAQQAADLMADPLDQNTGDYSEGKGTAVDMYGVNIELENTSYTALLDNTSADGVPVVTAEDPSGLTNIIYGAVTGGEFDSNPAHIIYECLIDTTWGMGESPENIDKDSFLAAANTLYGEGLGLSMAWVQESTIEEYVNEVLTHIDGVVFTNPHTGLLTLRLSRGDYDPDTLPVLTPDHCTVTTFSRKAWGETPNEVKVTWTNPANEQAETVVVQDPAGIASQGAIISTTQNFFGVRSAALAMKLASRDLRTLSYPISSVELEMDRSGWNLAPMDVVKLNYPEYGINDVVMRIGQVDYGKVGSGTVRVSMVEDIFSLPFLDYTIPPDTSWEPPATLPKPTDMVLVMPAPYYGLGSVMSDPEPVIHEGDTYAVVLAAPSTKATPNYDLITPEVAPNGDESWGSADTDRQYAGLGTLAAPIRAEAFSPVPIPADPKGGDIGVNSLMLFGGGDLDPHRNRVVSNVVFHGPENSSDFINVDTKGLPWGVVGSPRQVSTDAGFGMLSPDGTYSYLTYTGPEFAEPASRKWTFEILVNIPRKPPGGYSRGFFQHGTRGDCVDGIGIEMFGTGEVYMRKAYGTKPGMSDPSYLGRMLHVAVCSNGTNTTLFIDGKKGPSMATPDLQTNTVRIGRTSDSWDTNAPDFVIGGFRYTADTARYTDDFDPPEVFGSGQFIQDAELALVSGVDAKTGWPILQRGILDTVPRAWPAGTPVWFGQLESFSPDATVWMEGSTSRYKVLPNAPGGTLPEGEASEIDTTMLSRASLPLRPADVRAATAPVGGITVDPASQAIVPITWAGRNRLTEDAQILPWTAEDTIVESGATVTITVLDLDDNELDTLSGLTGTSYDLDVSGYVDLAPDGIQIFVGAERDGDASWSRASGTIYFGTPMFVRGADGRDTTLWEILPDRGAITSFGTPTPSPDGEDYGYLYTRSGVGGGCLIQDIDLPVPSTGGNLSAAVRAFVFNTVSREKYAIIGMAAYRDDEWMAGALVRPGEYPGRWTAEGVDFPVPWGANKLKLIARFRQEVEVSSGADRVQITGFRAHYRTGPVGYRLYSHDEAPESGWALDGVALTSAVDAAEPWGLPTLAVDLSGEGLDGSFSRTEEVPFGATFGVDAGQATARWSAAMSTVAKAGARLTLEFLSEAAVSLGKVYSRSQTSPSTVGEVEVERIDAAVPPGTRTLVFGADVAKADADVTGAVARFAWLSLQIIDASGNPYIDENIRLTEDRKPRVTEASVVRIVDSSGALHGNPLREAILTSSPVGFWPMNEEATAGAMLDVSLHGLDAPYLLDSQYRGVEGGPFGRMIRFSEGSGTSIHDSIANDLVRIPGDVTAMVVLANLRGDLNDGYLVSVAANGDSSATNFVIGLKTSGGVGGYSIFEEYGSGTNISVGLGPYLEPVEAMRMLHYVREGEARRLYVDGVKTYEVSAHAPSGGSSGRLRIGNNPYNSGEQAYADYAGSALWNRALRDAEIAKQGQIFKQLMNT